MRHPLLITLGITGNLLEILATLARNRGVVHRQVRRPRACLSLLQGGTLAVVVVRPGQDLEQEISLLDQLTRKFPESATVILDDSGNPALTGLAWDLGAACVVAPPLGVELVSEIVERLLDTIGATSQGSLDPDQHPG